MRPDQHALDETVRIGFQIVAVLERAGLALVAIDRHQPRPGLAEHRAPFAPGGEAGAAEAAQRGVVECLQQIFLWQLAGAQAAQQLVAAASDIAVVVDIFGQMRVSLASLGRRHHMGDGGVIDEVVADFRHGRSITTTDAGRAHDADARSSLALQILQQPLAAEHGAGQRIADADRQRRNVRLALLHHVEMRVERRGLEHLGEGELHLVGERRQMGSRDLVVLVLDQVQIFDQKVAPPRPVAEQ
ncbi:hypothetical protein ABIG06_004152 [Bradyrhizobium sp. USDA 326]